MKLRYIRLSAPILSLLLLIGILLLSGVLYYRAIKIQRFLEPALAISIPRSEFTQNIKQVLSKEFGAGTINGIRVTTGSIFVEGHLLFDSDNSIKDSAYEILKKLSRVFASALRDEHMSSHVDIIIVSARFPLSSAAKLNDDIRFRMQRMAEMILSSMYKADPELEKNYGAYFTTAAIPMGAAEKETAVIEFRIVPSELLHVEALQMLGKYAF